MKGTFKYLAKGALWIIFASVISSWLPLWVNIIICMLAGWYADEASEVWLPSLYNYSILKLNNWAKT
jgi:hypothetical protein